LGEVGVVAESAEAGRLPEQRSIRRCRDRSNSESDLGLFHGQDRRRVAVVATTDGRRVHVPVDSGSDGVVLALLRTLLLGLDGLLGLITGSRRENGGSRR
jgi:hypothetical protein